MIIWREFWDVLDVLLLLDVVVKGWQMRIMIIIYCCSTEQIVT